MPRPGRIASHGLAALLCLSVAVAGADWRFPHQPGPFLKSDLVELRHIDPTIRLDIRYATRDNFLHRPLYRQARAFLQRPAALALARAAQGLRSSGYGLVVFDGYRPWSVTRDMARSSPASWIGPYVANPAQGSRHNRGCAVDLSLVNLADGREVEMPTGFDDFSRRAQADSPDGAPLARAHRQILQQVMTRAGFLIYPPEWWHFDFSDWKRYAVMDVPFEAIP